MRVASSCICLLFAVFSDAASAASEFATIVADEIIYSTADRKFVAVGNVVANWKDEQFKAERIDYDGKVLRATGDLEFRDEHGNTAIADFGELSIDFRDALLESVQLLLEGRLRIDADRLERNDGRYLRLSGAMATACDVCREGGTPIWHFRARSIEHDAENDQIYLRNSRFYIKNVPVLYFPWLRIPDPSVTRTSGFLFPTMEFSDDVGIGVEIPYYLTLGDHADMTFTPELTTRSHQALAVEYRRRFRTGHTELDTSAAFDDSASPSKRWHVNSTSEFNFGNEFKLKATGERVSDPSYLKDYEISSKPRIENEIRLARRQPASVFEAVATEFEILDGSLPSRGAPLLIQEARWNKRFPTDAFGGRTSLEAGVANFRNFRIEDDEYKEVARTSARLTWNRDWAFASGVRASVTGDLLARAYSYAAAPDDDIRHVTPNLSGELRWPWIRGSEDKQEIVEPIASVAWAPRKPVRNLNLDSGLVEFDDTSFHDSSRFPGIDAVEQGLRVNYGVRYATHAPDSFDSSFFVGRVYQKVPNEQFGPRSGLDATYSKWAAALDLEIAEGFSFRQKILANNDFSPARSDMILNYGMSDYGISVQRSWEKQDFAMETEEAMNHWLVQAEYPLAGDWTGSIGAKYDANKYSERRIDFNFNYAHQCLDVRLFVSHRLPSAELNKARTSLGLSIELAGFGEGTAGSAERCG